MAKTREQLMDYLQSLGIETETVEHPPVFTVEEAKAHRGALAGAHIKNLFLKDKKGDLFLVVALEDRPINLKEFRHRVGAKNLSFGKPELLMEVLGIEPGSVTLFSVINDRENRVRVVLDKALLEIDPINAHPLTNTATTAISGADVLKFLDHTNHPPQIVEF